MVPYDSSVDKGGRYTDRLWESFHWFASGDQGLGNILDGRHGWCVLFGTGLMLSFLFPSEPLPLLFSSLLFKAQRSQFKAQRKLANPQNPCTVPTLAPTHRPPPPIDAARPPFIFEPRHWPISAAHPVGQSSILTHRSLQHRTLQTPLLHTHNHLHISIETTRHNHTLNHP